MSVTGVLLASGGSATVWTPAGAALPLQGSLSQQAGGVNERLLLGQVWQHKLEVSDSVVEAVSAGRLGRASQKNRGSFVGTPGSPDHTLLLFCPAVLPRYNLSALWEMTSRRSKQKSI